MADAKEVKQEEKQDKAPKKGKKAKGGKKGKLPVMIALVAVLGGGGFFGMKMARGGHEEAPELKLGDTTHYVDLGEYMVNTSDGKSFLKAKVVVHLAEGTSLFAEAGGGHGEAPGIEQMAPYVDAVRGVLSGQSLQNLTAKNGQAPIKKQIAEKVNGLYAQRNPESVKKLPKAAKGAKYPGWDSTVGPVLVVYLTDLVWES